jgi:asparagine synthase (glutamine-hydrolysing)
MSFFGYISPRAGDAFAISDRGIRDYACTLSGHRLALRDCEQYAVFGAQGIVLFGSLFHPAKLASELQVEQAGEPELLLHAWRKWGIDFPNHVQGEYSFVAWDANTGRLLLGRDPSGCRPLYYMQRGENLVFASEIRHILSWAGRPLRPSESRIADWLALNPTYTTQTFFEGILSVQPGTTLLFENGRVHIDDFWRPEQTPMLRLRDSREYAEGLIDVFDRAVQDRLPADSALGANLSGGLDSSSVAVTAARLLAQEGRRVFAFTAVPEHAVEVPGRFTDEGPHAAAIAAMYPNIDHILVRHGTHSAFSLIDTFNALQEEPIFNPANYDWLYEIYLQAQRHGVTSVMDGFLGNFTFSYTGNRALQSLLGRGRFLAFARLAADLQRDGSRRWHVLAHELLRPWMPISVRHGLDRLRGKQTGTLEYSMIRREFAREHNVNPMTLEDGHVRLDSREFRIQSLRRPDLGPVTSALRQLTGVHRTDPTGDRRVIEYCLSVPVEYYCEKGVPRSLIRNAMVGRLPEMVRTERRKGLQAADYSIHFEADRQEALAELERMKKVDLVVRALDLPAMEAMLRMAPAQIAERGGILGFWPKLLRAFSLGRFLRRLDDGTLFSASEFDRSAAAGPESSPPM